MLSYLLEVILCSGILLLFYRLLILQRVSHTAARLYLVLSMVAAVIIPALRLPLYPAETLYYAVPILSTANTVSATLPADMQPTLNEAPLQHALTWSEVLTICWVVCAMVAMLILAVHLMRLYRLRHNCHLTHLARYTIAESDAVKSPFSFWRTIFLSPNNNATEREQIVAHEAAHIRRLHTLDRLLAELLRIPFWFNPFLWLIERRLVELHEWQADRDVLDQGFELKSYRMTIFKQLFGYNPDIACGLSNSFTKKRFLMMTQSSSGHRSLWRIGAAIPLMAVLIWAFGATAREATHAIEQSDSTILFHRPADGKVLMSLYGTFLDPVTKEKREHNGVDIMLSKGAPIYAATDGVVTFAGEKNGYGRLIEIAHEAGYVTRYAHLDRIAVTAGDSVVRGRRIATAGDSGRATGPHLHFELLKEGQPIDPTPILRGEPNTSYVHVSRDGIYINGERTEEEELAERINSYREQANDPSQMVLVLNGDHTTSMGNVTDVKEAMREAGVLRLSYGNEVERILPPKAEPRMEHGVELMASIPKTIKQRNLFMIYMNAKGEIVCGAGAKTKMHRNLEGVSDYLERFLTNPGGVRELPEQQEERFTLPDGRTITYPVSQGYVTLLTAGEAPAEEYVALLRTVTETYTKIRSEVARTCFGKPLSALTPEELALIHKMVPLRVGEEEAKHTKPTK